MDVNEIHQVTVACCGCGDHPYAVQYDCGVLVLHCDELITQVVNGLRVGGFYCDGTGQCKRGNRHTIRRGEWRVYCVQ